MSKLALIILYAAMAWVIVFALAFGIIALVME